MYRGMLDGKKSRPMRIMTIFFTFFIFFIPGLCIFAFSIFALTYSGIKFDIQTLTALVAIIIGGVFILIALKIIVSNIRPKK